MLRKLGISAFLALAVCASGACSSDSDDGGTSSCTTNPWSCGAGQNCWADANNKFACMPAGTKQKGEPCSNMAGGSDCAEGMICFQNVSAGTPAYCTPYCDTAHGCAPNEACATAVFQQVGVTVKICIGGTGGTGGSGGSAGSSGSSGSAGSAGSASGGTAGSSGAAGSAGSAGSGGAAGGDAG